MSNFKRLCVIKTGWAETYDGDRAAGNFAYLLDDNSHKGSENFNMTATPNGFEVFSMALSRRAAWPEPQSGWTVVHVALDPARKQEAMRIIGWYEDAEFLDDYYERTSGEGRRYFNIRAKKAFLFKPADRPHIAHTGKFGSGPVYWLSGNEASTGTADWTAVRKRIIKALDQHGALAVPAGSLSPAATKAWLGDTRKPLKNVPGLDTDDGGQIYGRNTAGESDEHLNLRLWARDNRSAFIDDGGSSQGETEYLLPSGDRADAAHESDDEIVLIEAKSMRSGEADQERGIYQCVKYRAVQEAVLKLDKQDHRDVRVVLLTQAPLPARLQVLAKTFNVELLIQLGKN